jgi:hypothetical protein
VPPPPEPQAGQAGAQQQQRRRLPDLLFICQLFPLLVILPAMGCLWFVRRFPFLILI